MSWAPQAADNQSLVLLPIVIIVTGFYTLLLRKKRECVWKKPPSVRKGLGYYIPRPSWTTTPLSPPSSSSSPEVSKNLRFASAGPQKPATLCERKGGSYDPQFNKTQHGGVCVTQ